jgi:HlyD family secretion protein
MSKKLIALLLLVVLVGGGIYYYEHRPKPAPTDFTLYGNVEIRQADLGFKVAGRINKLLVREGDKVKKGDLLATLETVSYEAEQKKAAADIANLEAIKANAEANYSRRQALYKAGAISKEQMETYRKESETATAQVEAAKQIAIVSNESVKDTNLYAPSDGIITTRAKEDGSVVSAGTVIYTLAIDAPLWIRAYVDEPHLGNIAYGTKATIFTDSVDPNTGKQRSFKGHVGYISPTAEFTPKTVQTESQRTDLVYRIRIYVDDQDPFLRQGMPVTVKIDLKKAAS